MLKIQCTERRDRQEYRETSSACSPPSPPPPLRRRCLRAGAVQSIQPRHVFV